MPSIGTQELNDRLMVSRRGAPDSLRTQTSDVDNSIIIYQWGDLHRNSLTSHSRRLEGYNFGSLAVFFLFLLTIFIVISWLLRCCQHFVEVENIRLQQHQQQHAQRQSSDALSASGVPTATLIRREIVPNSAEQLALNEALKKSREEYIKSFIFTKDASVETLCQDQKRAETVEGRLRDPTSDLEENAVENCCSICLDEYAHGDRISGAKNTSSCQHLFHEHCITSWLMNHDNCPICRVSYFDANTNSNEAE